jgi:DNA-binding response OmpR family regulator
LGTPKRILAVDDDPSILRLLRDLLEHAGYEVMTATSGSEAFRVLERGGLPHLALVDISMPEMDGIEFASTVLSYTDLPFILVSALDDERTVVRGIECCAEDYIVKPFRPGELLARVQRVLSRVGSYDYVLAGPTKVDERLSVDFSHQAAQVDGVPVNLTPTETKLLFILVRNAGRTVTTDFLLRRIWPVDEVFEDTLRVHIHRLRGKIEPEPARPSYVLTQRGTGYRFRRL